MTPVGFPGTSAHFAGLPGTTGETTTEPLRVDAKNLSSGLFAGPPEIAIASIASHGEVGRIFSTFTVKFDSRRRP
jgi:hypothetical protein